MNIKIICAECKEVLEAEVKLFNRDSNTLYIQATPCEKCLDEATDSH